MEVIYPGKRNIFFMLAIMMTALAVSFSASAAGDTAEYFSASDYNDVSSEIPSAFITLNGNQGTISDDTLGTSGNPVILSRKGVYRVSGNANDVTILIEDTKESGNIYLVLDNVSMSNAGVCIDIEKADKVIIQCVGKNSLTSTAPEKAAIFSRDDLTINGPGSLDIISGKHGISCNDILRISGSELSIQAHDTGLKANDSIYIGAGSISVLKSYEGCEAEEVIILGGETSLLASDDGINAAGAEKNTGIVVIQSGTLYINSGGDGIDSNHSIYILGGEIIIEGPENSRNSILDKGDSQDAVLSISGGTVLAIGAAENAKIFESGNQYSRLEIVSGSAGDIISTDDGLTFTTSKSYDCILYSSPRFSVSQSITVQKAN